MRVSRSLGFEGQGMSRKATRREQGRQHRRNWVSRAAVLLVGLLPLSCAHVMESTVGELTLSDPSLFPWPLCRSSLGAYFLPTSFVRVEVSEYKQGDTTFNVLEKVEAIVRPDSRRVFCLDHLASVVTSDQVLVTKTSDKIGDKVDGRGSQLLATVASNSIDQSAIIIRRAIRTAFTAMSGFRSFRGFRSNAAPDKTDTLANFEFDPFNQLRSAYINDRLRKTGFCLVLESYTYGGPLHAANAYCSDPLGYIERFKPPFAQLYAEYDTAPVAPRLPGIVYRPRVEFQLHIFMKDDPRGPERWLLRKSMPVMLENISPVLSLAVDRAVFTRKQIAFVFDKGSLQKMCLFKGSEALAAVQIPLEVVKSIARLPTEIFQIQYDEVTQSQKLVKAQTDLLLAQDKYLALLNSTEATTTPASGTIAQPDKEFAVKIDNSDKKNYTLGEFHELATFAGCEPKDVRQAPKK
jgi:hypothetical protein